MPGTKDLVPMTTEGQRKETAREIRDQLGELVRKARAASLHPDKRGSTGLRRIAFVRCSMPRSGSPRNTLTNPFWVEHDGATDQGGAGIEVVEDKGACEPALTKRDRIRRRRFARLIYWAS